MKLQFLGAAHEVTGSCTLLEAAGKRILIDCGMEQGADLYENAELPVSPAEIDAVLLTHAHIDHSGKLPMLAAQGFSGPIYATGATEKLCAIMLQDSGHIQEQEAEWRNRKALRAGGPAYVPLYTVQDAMETMRLFAPCSYHEPREIFPGIAVRFLDAGHLLGSASIEITVTEGETRRVFLFSGDIGNIDRPLIRDPERPDLAADTVVIESTYGDRLHGERKDYLAQLTAVLQDTFDRGGNVVIPSFAVGRTQEFLYLLRKIKEQGLVRGHDGFPVFVDSPLAVEATKIYFSDLTDYYDDETRALVARGINLLEFPGLNVAVTPQESTAINEDRRPKVILSASGMCEAGRIRHHLKHNLWRADSTVLFVGYQAEGTMGRLLQDGRETVKLFGETIRVNAKIATMDGVSGHGDQKILLEWLSHVQGSPRVFVNHGNDTVTDSFAALITERLGFPATAPYNGAIYDAASGALLQEGNRVRLQRTGAKEQRAQTVFDRLVAAGKRLLAVIEKNRGGANKDLARFADQINALSDKWDQ